ncbi:MAG TPA: hypothetical protein VG754_10100 [Verrucomicrobiae bacterium]|jgi:hypothetical protein|nr:hypothetical protein [Verrucomicrobiae bacterium]
MKSISLLVVLSLLASAHLAKAVTITFDDLPTGNSALDWVVIPNGYYGYNWTGFGAINATTVTPPSGYEQGMVSPKNVAFDDNDVTRQASISSASAFNLTSAYLTAQIYNGMQVDVAGFIGATKIYDNIYIINSNAPTLINFDYQDVTKVTFTPENTSEIFVMDNLTLSPVPESNRYAVFIAGAGLIAFALWRKKFNTSLE